MHLRCVAQMTCMQDSQHVSLSVLAIDFLLIESPVIILDLKKASDPTWCCSVADPLMSLLRRKGILDV